MSGLVVGKGERRKEGRKEGSKESKKKRGVPHTSETSIKGIDRELCNASRTTHSGNILLVFTPPRGEIDDFTAKNTHIVRELIN